MGHDPRDAKEAASPTAAETAATAVERDRDAKAAQSRPDTSSLEVRVWPGDASTIEGPPPTVTERDGTDVAAPPPRYRLRDLLGEGGMGSVKLYHDALVGRDVALKVMAPRALRREAYQRRFVREARVQGQLEHPAVVPVYDVGTTSDGAPYFTMKRLGGHTLREVLDEVRQAGGFTAPLTQRRLLSDFVSVCRAVAFAHSRGVIHRDLKPANVMLGAFGEVYVLDWGIAKVRSDPEEPPAEPVGEAETWHGARSGDTPLHDVPPTAAGVVLGTPATWRPSSSRGARSSTAGPTCTRWARSCSRS
jgi:eukaryotic-like serine/threonine-protein kinase